MVANANPRNLENITKWYCELSILHGLCLIIDMPKNLIEENFQQN